MRSPTWSSAVRPSCSYGEPRLTKDIDITLGADLLRLRDVLQAMSRVRKVKLGATEVRFAAVEALLIHKVLAGRPRDLEDAKSVLLKNPRAELAYIRRWLGELATAIDEPLVQRFDQLIEALRP